jgi:hypothetical protein
METNIHPRIRRVVDTFDEIHAFVLDEPLLAEFVAVTEQLSAIGEQVRKEGHSTIDIPYDRNRKIPSRALARQLLDIVHEAPGPLDGASDEHTQLMGFLHYCLAVAIVLAIREDYEDLMQEHEDEELDTSPGEPSATPE